MPEKRSKAREKTIGKSVEEEIVELEQEARLDPTNASLLVALGDAYMKKGDVHTAIARYEEALKLDGNDAQIYIKLGTAYQSRGKIDEAIECYEHALKLDPGNREAKEKISAASAKKQVTNEKVTVIVTDGGSSDRTRTLTDGGEPISCKKAGRLDDLWPIGLRSADIKGSGIVEAPKHMKPAHTYSVQVTVSSEALPTGIKESRDQFEETVRLVISQSGFPIEIAGEGESFSISPKSQLVDIPLKDRAKTAVFHVTPKEKARADEKLLFWFRQKGRTLGVANLDIKISNSWLRTSAFPTKVQVRVTLEAIKIHV